MTERNQKDLELDKFIIRFGNELAQYIPSEKLDEFKNILDGVLEFKNENLDKLKVEEQLKLEAKENVILKLFVALKEAKEGV